MIPLIFLAILLVPFVLLGGAMALFWKRKWRSIIRWSAILYLTVLALFLFVIGPYLAAWSLVNSGSRPMDKRLKSTPADFQIPYEDIVFDARDSLRLSGWFVPPTGANAVVICTHGLFRNRLEVLARAIPLARAGYGALLYDSRSHGSSGKGIVSLGYYERNDVLGAIQYVRRRYQDAAQQPRIVLMGVSMGAIAVLQAAAETKGYSALILDSPFSSLVETAVDHCWLFFKLPRYPFSSLFLFWFERLAKFDPERVDTHKTIQRIEPVPLLIIASEGDQRMGPNIARTLRAESKSTMKKLEIFGKDVSHGAAARLHPEEYSALLKGFLDTALSEPTKTGAGQQTTTAPSASGGYPQ